MQENQLSVDKYSALIEAILFYENDIVKINKIAKITGLEESKVVEIMNSLMEVFQDKIHGIRIVEIADGYSFQVKKEILPYIKDYYKVKPQQKFSKSTLTVLSIIAYKQPITKNEIEDIRGVSCDNAVKKLMEANFIEIVGRKEALGKPLMFGTTVEFLKHFNLKNIKDLPTINELKSEEFNPEE
jgi:segregation and condensation protein B